MVPSVLRPGQTLPMSSIHTANAQLGENQVEQERLAHICILNKWRTAHLAKTTLSALMDGWVYAGKRHFWGACWAAKVNMETVCRTGNQTGS